MALSSLAAFSISSIDHLDTEVNTFNDRANWLYDADVTVLNMLSVLILILSMIDILLKSNLSTKRSS